jgi:hypothetical protein
MRVEFSSTSRKNIMVSNGNNQSFHDRGKKVNVKIRDQNSANMLFGTDGNIHYEHIPPTKHSKKAYYLKVLKCLL